MRVLYFVERFWPFIGGLEVLSARLVTALAERGHEMIVVTSNEHEWMPELELFGEVPVHRFPFTTAIHNRDIELLADARSRMNRLVREFQPDLIHASLSGPGIWMLPKDGAAPMILSLHGSWQTIDFAAKDGLFRRVMERAAWITACSQDALDDFLKAVEPAMAARSSVVLNGTDPSFDGEPPEPPDGPPTLFCSGRVVTDKGFDVAIDAVARLAERHPDLRLIVAGDGPARPSLRAQAEALGLSERVEFPGWVSPDGVHSLVARSRLVLVPSRLEGFGLSALEGMQMARPVIASDVGGLPEVVADGETGLLFGVGDADALAAAIDRLLRDPDAAAEIGRAGRRRALMNFNAKRHTDDWEALYLRVASGARG